MCADTLFPPPPLGSSRSLLAHHLIPLTRRTSLIAARQRTDNRRRAIGPLRIAAENRTHGSVCFARLRPARSPNGSCVRVFIFVSESVCACVLRLCSSPAKEASRESTCLSGIPTGSGRAMSDTQALHLPPASMNNMQPPTPLPAAAVSLRINAGKTTAGRRATRAPGKRRRARQ